MTAPSNAISPPISSAVSVVMLGTWLVTAQIASVVARRATSFLAKEVPRDALGAAMPLTAKWRYVISLRILESMLTRLRTLCKNFLGTLPTAQLDISRPHLVATHGTKVATAVARPLAPGSLVLLHLVVLLRGRSAIGKTTMGVVERVLHRGLNDKTAAAMVAMVVLQVLQALPVLLEAVPPRGSRSLLLHLPLAAAMVAMGAILAMINKAMAVHLPLLPQVSATSCSNTASKHHRLHHPTFQHPLPARLLLRPQEMCLLHRLLHESPHYGNWGNQTLTRAGM